MNDNKETDINIYTNNRTYNDMRVLPWIMPIDYKALLEKYVKIVLDEEGWLYVCNSHTNVHLTEEDKKELLRIQEDWRNE